MTKNRVFCYRSGRNVAYDHAKECLAFDGNRAKGRFCGYCKHALSESESDMRIDLDIWRV